MDDNADGPTPAPAPVVVQGFKSQVDGDAGQAAAMQGLIRGLQQLSVRPREKFNDPDAAATAQRDRARAALQLIMTAVLNGGGGAREVREYLEILNALDLVENGGDPAMFQKPTGTVGGKAPVPVVEAARRRAVVLLLEIYRQDHRQRTGKKLPIERAAQMAADKLEGFDPEALFGAYSRDSDGRKFRTDKLEAKTIKGYRAAIVNTDDWAYVQKLLKYCAAMPLERAERAALEMATDGEASRGELIAMLNDAAPGEIVSVS